MTSLRNAAVQTSFEDLGMPLADVTFVVVDLETTGPRPETDAITEIGAVKVRGGEIMGEFATLIDPGRSIPVKVAHLTGITSHMVCDAPRIQAVLPQFLDFLQPNTVLVAHNARFDVGFLKSAARDHALEFRPAHVLDTVLLARGLVSRDEAPNHKLGTLASLFNATTTPNHRALDDARATVDVLHALIERAGSIGIENLEDLLNYSSRVPPRRRRKSSLADGLPHEPGVYVFKDSAGEVLYVGTSKDIKQRVKSYFTAGEIRHRMGEMVDLACSVTPIPCPTALEGQIREVRLIAAHRPPYNRKSKRPEKAAWLKLTQERFPRLSIVRNRTESGALYIGPFRSTTAAESARDAVHSVRRIRQCTRSITLKTRGAPCALAELGRCDAPCTGGLASEDYAAIITPLHAELSGDNTALIADVEARIERLARAERFEGARKARDDLLALLEGLDRGQRQAPLLAADTFIAARRRSTGGWEFAAISRGYLVGTAVSEHGLDPLPVLASLRATSAILEPFRRPLTEETDLILKWLERPGTRVVESSYPWHSPLSSATPHLLRLEPRIRGAWTASLE